MFGSIEKSKGLLFCTHDLDQSLRNTVQAMRQEVEGLDANRLLNTAPQDLTQYFAEKHSVEPITLRREDWYADHKEVQVDVRYDSMRWIDDKSRPALVPGERIEVRVPFDGEPELFYSSPNTMTSNPPRAVVEKNELVLRYESPSDAPRDVRPLVDKALSDIEQYLGWQRGMIETHNSSLVQAAEQAIEQRRERLLAQSQRASTLEYQFGGVMTRQGRMQFPPPVGRPRQRYHLQARHLSHQSQHGRWINTSKHYRSCRIWHWSWSAVLKPSRRWMKKRCVSISLSS